MNENELKFLLTVVLSVIVSFLIGWLLVVAIPNFLENIYKKNQVKYIEKAYKRWFKWFISERGRILNDKAELKLVELSEKSPVHREMLALYDCSLDPQAAEKYVNIFLKPETYEFFKSRKENFNHELDVIIKKAADGDELSQKFLLEYAEEGRRFSDNQITALSANEKLKHIFRRYCENRTSLGDLAERKLVELSPNDEAFYKVLSKFINDRKNCSPKEIAYKAEIELFRHKELFDIQVAYIKITGKCPPWESFQLLANHSKEEKRYKELLLNLFEITEPSDELIEYAIESNDEDFLGKLNVFIGKTNKGNAAERNGLNEGQQIMLSKAFNENGEPYRACLETQIEVYGLCEKARDILNLGHKENKVSSFGGDLFFFERFLEYIHFSL